MRTGRRLAAGPLPTLSGATVPAIVSLLLVSAGCLLYNGYRLAHELAFRRRALRATGRISRLTADSRDLDAGPATGGLEVDAIGRRDREARADHEEPVLTYPVEIATVAVLVAPRRTVDRTLPHSPVDPGRYRVGDTVSLRLDPHGRREPVLDGAGPDPLLRWAGGFVFFAASTGALGRLLALLADGPAA